MDSYQDDLTYLVDYAKVDWVGMSVLVGVASAQAGDTAKRDEVIAMMLRLTADLIDQGAVPGDLSADGFDAWPGDKPELLGRLGDELHAFDGLPDTGEVCWFFAPTAQAE